MTRLPAIPVHIRPATVGDLRAIAPLVRQLHYRIGSESTLEAVIAVMSRYIEGQGCIMVAESEQSLCGYACASFQWRSDTGGEVMNVIELFVEEPWRNRGVARNLVQVLVRFAQERGVRRVAAEVHEGNAAIERVLEAAGFEPERRTIWFRDSGPSREG